MRRTPRALGWLSLVLLTHASFAQEAGAPPPPGSPEAAQDQPAEALPDSIPVEPLREAGSMPPPGEPETATALDEITVTATKRTESPRELASSVAVLGGEEMEKLGLRDVDDIVAQVPGVNIWDLQTGTQPKKITVRGISAELGTAATTGVFLDETPFNDPVAAYSVLDMNPFDLYSVEVLKGPVGTLFGGSGLNGAIRYIPEPPAFGEWQTRVFGEIGSIQEGGISKTYGGAINVPLFGRDDLALRLVGVDRHSAGYMDSVHPQYTKEDIGTTEQQAARALLGWNVTDRLSLTGMYVRQETAVDDVLRFTERQDGALEKSATARPSPSENNYEILALKGKYAFDGMDLAFNVAGLEKVGYVFADASYIAVRSNPPPNARVFATFDGTSSVQELRLLSTDGGDWDWLGGVFNYSYDVAATGGLDVPLDALAPVLGAIAPIVNALPGLNGVLVNDSGNVTALDGDIDGKVTEQALFGELNWRFAEGFEATGGLRVYRFSYDIAQVFRGAGCVLANPACPTTLFVSEEHPTSEERGINPKLSLKWNASENILGYVTLSKGYRFGGVNIIPHPDAPRAYKSDSLWNLEAGLRAEWFDKTLITDISVYGIRWSDAQVSITTTDVPVTYVDNVGKVAGKGVEAQLIWLTPVPGVRLTVIPAYADIRTAEPFTSGSGQVIPEGKQWPLSPRWATSTSLAWTDVLLDANRVGVTLTHRYTDKTPQQLTQPGEAFGFGTWSVQFTYEHLNLRYLPQLALNVNNLTDERGVNFHNTGGGLTPLTGYVEPRNGTLRATFRF